MKTTLDIPEQTLEEVIRFTGAKTKREAVVTALEDFNRRRRVDQFIEEAKGAFPNFPTNDEIEAADLEDEKKLNALWGHES